MQQALVCDRLLVFGNPGSKHAMQPAPLKLAPQVSRLAKDCLPFELFALDTLGGSRMYFTATGAKAAV
jgi:hypothetical protein